MKQKSLRMFLTMLVALVSTASYAYDACINGIYYNFSGTRATVTYLSINEQSNAQAYSGEIVIPSTVEYNGNTYKVTAIGFMAFCNCSSLTSVFIPNSITTIGQESFACCTNLLSISIPESVISIGGTAFRECSSLTSINIPNSVNLIQLDVFQGCSNLTSITVSEGNTKYDSRDNCNAIIETSTNTLISGCANTIIPNSVTSIEKYAFHDCSGLTSIKIPNSITSIANSAFYNCSGLTSIEIPRSITSIESSTFSGCSGLTSVNIPESVTSIGGGAFSGCSGLTSIKIPNSITSIANSAFYNCSGLTSIEIPRSITSIGWQAFYGCSGLTSIKIPESVTSIGGRAFNGCSGLTSIEIPSSITSIEDGTFSGCSGLTSIDIPECVTSIGSSAFKGCSGLTSIDIPRSITSIESSTFSGCSRLTSIDIPECVTSIGPSAFYGCSGLMSIEIPSSVTSIGSYAFAECKVLTSVNIPESVTSIEDGIFRSCPGLTSINIPNGVTSIGEDAFRQCIGLTSINIPNGVTSIGKSAFLDCRALTSLDIPNSVTAIGDYAFAGCSRLTDLDIPNSVITIGDCAFWSCYSFRNINIPNSVTSIGDEAFLNCNLMTSINIPNSVTSIGIGAFEKCPGLTSITLASLPKGIASAKIPTTTKIYVPKAIYNDAVALFPNNEVIALVENYTITATTADETMGSVTGTGEYEEDTEVTLTAIPAEGYEFVQWSDGTTENPYTFTATGNLTLTATFRKIEEEVPTSPDLSELDYAIYADDTQVFAGTSVVLPLRLKNTASITNFQFDLRLPEGVTIATDSYGDADIQLATERTTLARHSLSYNEQANGDMRVVCTSLKNATFSGNDGNVVLVRLNIAEGMEEGDYPIVLSNIEMSEPDMTKHKVPLYTSKLHIDDYLLGDVDGDREVTVTDVTGVVNIILGIPMTGANEKAADVSGDGEVTVTDATGVVNIILGIPNGSSTRRAPRTTNAALDIAPFSVIAGEKVEVPIVLQSGADEFTGMQFDLVLPAGLRLIDVAADRRHNADFATRCEGTERIVSLSLSNATYAGNGTAALTLTLAADSDVEAGNILLSGIELVRPDLSNIRLGALSAPFAVAGTTGVEALNAGTAANTIYDLQGRKTRGTVKGVYMQNGQKVIK